ncbi:GntR family transcriptional regulator [Streptomyces sp. NPDC005859]|uniref:GntR family transcriptional regulator n=1 Tax=Streptomyces sp. NPDC005859 TaxID=3157170 RepID=UPI0033D2B20B
MSTTQAADKARENTPAPSGLPVQPPGTAAGSEPAWQEPLQGLPRYPGYTSVQGDDRERFRAAVATAYAAGGSARNISEVIGRSPSWVNILLAEAGVKLRPRGWPGRPENARTPNGGHATAYVENTLRNRMADGTYEVGTKIPATYTRKLELGVSASPVNSAIERLATAGFLLGVKGRGTVVTDLHNPPQAPQLRVQAGQWQTWTIHEPGRPRRLMSTIIARIADGTYPAGHRIPDRSAFAEEFNLGYPNVPTALKPLQASGILVAGTSRTAGLFVAPPDAGGAATKAATP